MRWTNSDTVGFLIALAILVMLPVAVHQYLENAMRKPGQPPPAVTTSLAIAGAGLAGTTLSSALACRFGGSAHGRWAIHGLFATILLLISGIGCCAL